MQYKKSFHIRLNKLYFPYRLHLKTGEAAIAVTVNAWNYIVSALHPDTIAYLDAVIVTPVKTLTNMKDSDIKQ